MRHAALKVLIVSVVVSALLGISALLGKRFGEVEIKVLLTTLCVSGASLVAMACAAAWERGIWMPVGPVGVALSVLGFGLLIVGIWAESEKLVLYKLSSTLIYLSGASAYAGLVGLTGIAPRLLWIRPVAVGLAYGVAIYFSALFWAESQDEWAWRWFGVVAILLASATVLVPVFQRMSRDELRAAEEPASDAPRYCPACGEVAAREGDALACGACGGRFRVARLG